MNFYRLQYRRYRRNWCVDLTVGWLGRYNPTFCFSQSNFLFNVWLSGGDFTVSCTSLLTRAPCARVVGRRRIQVGDGSICVSIVYRARCECIVNENVLNDQDRHGRGCDIYLHVFEYGWIMVTKGDITSEFTKYGDVASSSSNADVWLHHVPYCTFFGLPRNCRRPSWLWWMEIASGVAIGSWIKRWWY